MTTNTDIDKTSLLYSIVAKIEYTVKNEIGHLGVLGILSKNNIDPGNYIHSGRHVIYMPFFSFDKNKGRLSKEIKNYIINNDHNLLNLELERLISFYRVSKINMYNEFDSDYSRYLNHCEISEKLKGFD